MLDSRSVLSGAGLLREGTSLLVQLRFATAGDAAGTPRKVSGPQALDLAHDRAVKMLFVRNRELQEAGVGNSEHGFIFPAALFS